MKCPNCNARLIVTHTYSAGNAGRTATAKCQNCDLVATIVSTIAEINPPRGKGAAAVAKGMKAEVEKSP